MVTNSIRKELLDAYYKELSESLHICPPVQESNLQKLHRSKKYTRLLGAIRDIMHLPIRLEVGYVSSGGPKNGAAWIRIPKSFPLFGTKEFRTTLFHIYISNAFLERAPFETVVMAMAHECSHIILESLGHALRKKEIAVDMTAMMLGFEDFYLAGHTYITTRSREVPLCKVLLRQWKHPFATITFLIKMCRSGNSISSLDIESVRSVCYLNAEEIRYVAEKIKRSRTI